LENSWKNTGILSHCVSDMLICEIEEISNFFMTGTNDVGYNCLKSLLIVERKSTRKLFFFLLRVKKTPSE
jgi:hypothetical protein